MSPVIEVKNLTKEYNLGTVTSAKDTLRHTLAKLRGKNTWHRENFKALDDINFSVEKGEVIGIIGHNGAGKSTLLKHLANITKPTSGEVVVRGSVAPLIEVGAGINPELTGRENIFLNGAILGIPKNVIRDKVNSIIEFSELEKFIDTPVKRYSSGMQVKLGFSIATSMDAEILIIDEVLAVGDLAFQRKCFNRMEELIHQQGRTVLLVSHNIRQVERMCSRVILLNQGKILQDGESHSTCDQFYQINNKVISNQNNSNTKRISTSGEVTVEKIDIIDGNNQPTESITEGSTLKIRIKFTLNNDLQTPEFHIGTHTTDFIYLTGESTALLKEDFKLSAGTHEIEQHITSYPLVPGSYGIRMAVIDQKGRVLFYGENLHFFNVTAKTSDSPLQDELRLIASDVTWKGLLQNQQKNQPTEN